MKKIKRRESRINALVGNPDLNPVEGKVKGEGLHRKRFP